MQTIADRVGVTKTTVSLALRGRPNVSEPMREKILQVARELGYRRDPALSAIAAHRWGKPVNNTYRGIAFICHGDRDGYGTQREFFKPAQERAAELGYTVQSFNITEYPTAEAAARVLRARGVRGLLVPPILNPDSKRAMNLPWNEFTAVCCAVGRAQPKLHSVRYDVFHNTRLAWEKVLERGFKRIGAAVCCHRPAAEDDFSRIGASHSMRDLYGASEARKIPFLLSHPTDVASLIEWYEAYRPEVIIGFNNSVAVHLTDHGLRIPEDVSFVSLVTHRASPYAGIIRQADQVARDAVDLLAAEIRDNQWGMPPVPRIIMTDAVWNEGSSLGYAAGSEANTRVPFSDTIPTDSTLSHHTHAS